MPSNRQRSEEEIRDLRARIGRLGFWYHNIDLGDGVWTNPDHPHGDYPSERWRLIEPFVPEDCRRCTVLDIGCNAGYFSLQFKQRGAAYVLGIDEDPEYLAQARLAARELGLDIDYRCMSVYDFDRLADVPERFDFVLFMGVLYHLRHPLLMLDKLSRLRPKKMYFQTMLRGPQAGPIKIATDYPLQESELFNDPRYPAMYFVEHRFGNDATNWWMVNDNGIRALLRSAGFTRFTETENREVFICDAPTHEPGQGCEPALNVPPMRLRAVVDPQGEESEALAADT